MDGESEVLPATSEVKDSTENEPLFCDRSRKQFPSKKSFDKHCEQNRPKEKLICDNCNKTYSKKHNCKIIIKKSSDEYVRLGKRTGGKPFECVVSRKNKSSPLKRIRNYTSDRKHGCIICQKYFQRKIFLQRHLRTHTGEKPYTCEVCFKCFATRGQFNVHSRIHTGEKPYTCDICCKRFRHLDTLKYHKFVHTKPDRSQLYNCNVCGSSFRKRSTLLRHGLRHKKGFKPNLTQNKKTLVDSTHIGLKHTLGSNDKKFRCQDNLKAENDAHTERKPYVCHTCQQCFPDEKSFLKHSDTHTNTTISVISPSNSYGMNLCDNLKQEYHCHVEKKLICDVCDKQFIKSDDLKIHFKTHTEQKYYICKVCQLCFIDEDDLRNHKNIEKCFHFHTCKICGEKFVDKLELEKHSGTHVGSANEVSPASSSSKLSNLDQHCSPPSTANINVELSEKCLNSYDYPIEKHKVNLTDLSYNCKLCNKNFTNKYDLKQHNVLHTEKESHICVLCLKNFDEKRELQAHICKFDKKKPILSQTKVYICNVCLKSFTYYYEFQCHQVEHMKENECKTCGKRFFTEKGLEEHQKSHKPPMHPCIVCKEKFANKSDLIAHCLSHLGSGEYFICGSCKQCFKGREDLHKHGPCFLKTKAS